MVNIILQNYQKQTSTIHIYKNNNMNNIIIKLNNNSLRILYK